MKNVITAACAASILALTAGGAIAQSYPQTWEQYQSQQRDYQRQRSAYDARSDDYAAQRRAYEAKREQYLRDQAAYDRRYGRGAYVRQYGEWRYDPYANSADYYGRDVAYTGGYAPYRDSPCEQNRDNRTAAGAIIGALAGAALGSNVASSGVRTEGAVLGALVGGVAGGSIGRNTARCDDNGYYYSKDQTISYREAGYNRNRSSRYAYNQYSRRGCRLAPAPVEYNGRVEDRYVRVCPDGSGRYRITG